MVNFFRVSKQPPSTILMNKTISFGTLATVYEITWCHKLGDSHRWGNLRSNIVFRNPTRIPAQLEKKPSEGLHPPGGPQLYNLCTQLSRFFHDCYCSNYWWPTDICSIALSFPRHPQPNERQMYYAWKLVCTTEQPTTLISDVSHRVVRGISYSLIAASAQNKETMGDFKRALSSKQKERRILTFGAGILHLNFSTPCR